MSTIYVWGADIHHCEDCYKAGKLDGPDCDGNEASEHERDHGESDSPTHCGTCGEHIPGPLTDHGVRYVAHAVARALRDGREPITDWVDAYSVRTDRYSVAELGDTLREVWPSVDLPQGYRVTLQGGESPAEDRYTVADVAPTPWHESPPVVLVVPSSLDTVVRWLVSRGLVDA